MEEQDKENQISLEELIEKEVGVQFGFGFRCTYFSSLNCLQSPVFLAKKELLFRTPSLLSSPTSFYPGSLLLKRFTNPVKSIFGNFSVTVNTF